MRVYSTGMPSSCWGWGRLSLSASTGPVCISWAWPRKITPCWSSAPQIHEGIVLSRKRVFHAHPWLLAAPILLGVRLVLYYKPLSGAYVFAGPDSLALAAASSGLRALAAETGEYPLWAP